MLRPIISNEDFVSRIQKIKLLLLDVDGVLTDGRLYFGNNGEEFKSFSTLDGHGIKMLQKSGVAVGIITGRTSQLVAKRAKDLGIQYLIQGREDKWAAMQELINGELQTQSQTLSISLQEIAFMGDDWPDLAVMTRVGLAFAPVNAHDSVAERAHWISKNRGGEGAVREVCDLIMQMQNKFESALQHYLPEKNR